MDAASSAATSSESAWEDHLSPPRVQVGGFGTYLPDGDPIGNHRVVSPMRICFPPDFCENLNQPLVEEASAVCQRRTGINIRPLIEENRRQATAYIEYVSQELQSREMLYRKIAKTEQELYATQNRLEDVRSACRAAKGGIPRGIKDLKDLDRTLLLETEQLERVLHDLKNCLLIRRAANEGLVAGMLGGKPLPTRAPEPLDVGLATARFAAPSTPTSSIGLGRKNHEGSDQRAPPPEASNENHFGLLLAGPDPDLEAKYKEMYRVGLANIAASDAAPDKIDNRHEIRVPEWFPAFDSMDLVALGSDGQASRFVELLNKIWRLEDEIRRGHGEAGSEARDKKKAWDKFFHEPSPGWPTEQRQAKGGWWRCREGNEAVPAEKSCSSCHSTNSSQVSAGLRTPRKAKGSSPDPVLARRHQHRPPPAERSPRDSLDEIMTLIGKAMAVVAERDKTMILASMECERADVTRYLRERRERVSS